jgi:hypothetical protein
MTASRNWAALSVLLFGLYMGGEGLILMFAPDFLLSLLALPLSQDAWPRTVGLALLVLGCYYVFAFSRNDRAFFRLSGFVRGAQLLFFVWLYAQGMILPILLVCGV